MVTFIKIYGLILGMGLIFSLIDNIVLKKKRNLLSTSLMYGVINYVSVALGRAIVGSGDNYLSYSFYGKELRGYIKVAILLVAVYVFNVILNKIFKDRYEKWLRTTIGIYSALAAMYMVFWDQLIINISCIIFIIAVIASYVLLICFKYAPEIESNPKPTFILLFVLFGLFSVMHYIVGPAEIYAYSKEDFIYSYLDLAPHLWSGAILFTLIFPVLIGSYTPQKIQRLTCLFIAAYNLTGYIQFFLLNGQMSSLDGSEQKWDASKMIINAIVWGVTLILFIVLAAKYKKAKKLIIGASIYIMLIQTVSYVYLFTSMDITQKKDKQVIEDRVFELGKENIIVFVLDAYDNQEIQMVLEDNPNYIEPLHDFTYYNNMNSRFYYTDFSLPYMLTGGNKDELDAEEKADTYTWYDNDCFLKDIESYGYDIRVLTEKKYVDKFVDTNPVKNYEEDSLCILDEEKTLSHFANAIRYRNMPFILKGFYRYGIYDFIDVIADTNIYRMGTDDKFDDIVNAKGLKESDIDKAYRFYHLYGAHAPYYMTEDARMDYSSCDPIAQFKGALKIVYDYLNELKKSGLYDNSTIIITADHGLNPGQVDALKDAGLSCDESKSNPIFFIKLKNEYHDELNVDSKPLSHDQMFDTVMKCIDNGWNNKYYETIWD